MRLSRTKLLVTAAGFALYAAQADAQAANAQVVGTCGTPASTYVAGTVRPLTVDTTGTLCSPGAGGANVGVNVHDSGGNPVTSLTVPNALNVNVAGTSGMNTNGQKTMANSTPVVLPSDQSSIPVAATLQAGSAIAGKVGIDQTTPGTTNAVSATNFPATVSTGTGAQGASSPRVTVATDSATIAGTASAVGHGTAAAALRVELPTDGTGVVGLAAGSAVIGHVINDAGSAVIGHVITDSTSVTSLIPGTTGGLTNYVVEPAASDNHANIKNGAGQVYGIQVWNNSATINYGRLYNAASGFNGCNSATNLLYEFHIPANTSDSGFTVTIPQGIAFSTGISICVTGAYGQTNTTNATASAISLDVQYN